MRILSSEEKEKLKLLTQRSIPLALIEPTGTALEKSIMDATAPVRNYLKENNVHDYESQGQGPAKKEILKGIFITHDEIVKTKVSLYRPQTKEGDPRIWIYGLHHHAQPNDIIALLYYNEALYSFNLSQLEVSDLLFSKSRNPFKELIEEISDKSFEVADELLKKLRNIAALGPIPSNVSADTAVGRTLERELGIEMNSSKTPDYKGIEIKSFRKRRGNRKNLFAKVPNWELSKLKSSEAILDAFGYDRNGEFKLYCTVSAANRNPQGLTLRINDEKNWLVENSDNQKYGDFVIWELQTLHNSLLKKHDETFWISAESVMINGREHFNYLKVEHTKKPMTSQFDILLSDGTITVDHLIKRYENGGVREKGPLFKIKPNSLDLLFPPSQIYDLT